MRSQTARSRASMLHDATTPRPAADATSRPPDSQPTRIEEAERAVGAPASLRRGPGRGLVPALDQVGEGVKARGPRPASPCRTPRTRPAGPPDRPPPRRPPPGRAYRPGRRPMAAGAARPPATTAPRTTSARTARCRRPPPPRLAGRARRPGVVVVAYDTELFGHWWYEGPW